MKKHVLLTTMMLLLATTMVLSIPVAFAGDKNQNGDHGTQGTMIANDKEGCRPDVQAGSVWVQVVPPFVDGPWEGGPCCAARSEGYEMVNGYQVWEPNQCCNPPDDVRLQPGNHCECFHLRGYGGD
jgi:hypothetical protein